MKNQSIEIEILDSTPDCIKVKLPFLDIPVEMNDQFLRPRLESGYFRLRNESNHLFTGPFSSRISGKLSRHRPSKKGNKVHS